MKFLSQAEQSMQKERFLALKQGRKSVKEYVNEFNLLARSGLELVDTDHKKALRFARGLNEPLHSLAMSHVPMGATFEKLVDMAYFYEDGKDKKEVKKEEPQNKKPDYKKGGKNNKPRDKKKCHYCGMIGHVVKDCRRKKQKTSGCFHCGEAGHMIMECPKRQGQGAGPSRGQVHALVPATQGRNNSVSVESLVYLGDFPIRTLFDSGASHSFISASVVDTLHLDTCLVEDPIVFSNPIGGSAHLSLVCLDLGISILSVEFRCNA